MMMRRFAATLILAAILFPVVPSAPLRAAGPTPTATPIPMPPMPANLTPATVIKVIDGDTVDVMIGTEKERIRLIGIDTPERGEKCFRAAKIRLAALIGDGAVLLEADPSQANRDRFGRLLRYLWRLDGTLLNLAMIREGLAAEYTYRGNPYRYASTFRAAGVVLVCNPAA